jgi:hypothetical protein
MLLNRQAAGVWSFSGGEINGDKSPPERHEITLMAPHSINLSQREGRITRTSEIVWMTLDTFIWSLSGALLAALLATL